MDKIVELLKQNARLTDRQLAAMLGTTEKDVHDRISKLENDGIIKGYSAIIDESIYEPDKVSAIIELKVTPQADSGFDEIAKAVTQYDEVESVVLVSGAYDLAITVSGTSLKTVADFVAQRLSAIHGIISTATHFTLKTYKEKGIMVTEEIHDERGFVSP